MLSGGSPVSVSVTPLARTVTVQVSLFAKLLLGSSVLELPLPLVDAEWLPLLVQEIVNQVPTLTDSLKLTVMFALTATPVALFEGVVLETVGAASVVKLKT